MRNGEPWRELQLPTCKSICSSRLLRSCLHRLKGCSGLKMNYYLCLKVPIPLRKEELNSKSSVPECQCSCHDSSWVATVSAYSWNFIQSCLLQVLSMFQSCIWIKYQVLAFFCCIHVSFDIFWWLWRHGWLFSKTSIHLPAHTNTDLWNIANPS